MIGRTVSHYRILEELGRGGMGVVYKAEDTKLKRIVALKFLSPHLLTDKTQKTRFLHEAQAAAGLDHPNISTIHEVHEADGHTFMVMAFIEGDDVGKKMEAGPMELDEALDIAVQVARGLAKAHDSGIVHRDIKPGNVIITKEGLAKIVDFGLAKLATQTKLTKTGTAVGTVRYMSPEQATGGEVDHRTDIWSLGVMLYEMLAGRPPFRGEVETAMMYSILNEEPKPLTEIRPELPVALEDIVEKALAKDPQKRYPTMDAFLSALEGIRDQITLGIKEREFRGLRRLRRRKRLTAGMTAALVVVAAVILGPMFYKQSQAIDSIAVLPFANLSGDATQEYYSDGMTSTLINELQQVSALKVISRTTVMQFKNADKSLPEIARELKVDAIVEASVLKDGNTVRIDVQLIRANPEQQMWAESFTRSAGEVLSIHSEVARAIAERIQVAVTPEERELLTQAHPVNPKAYEAYLIGKSFVDKWVQDDVEKGILYLEQALEIDPDFADAHAVLAYAYFYSATIGGGWRSPDDAVEKARAEATRALALNESSAEAHLAMGGITVFFDWNLEQGERELRRAIELDPSLANARIAYSALLKRLGGPQRYAEALDQLRTVLQNDPLNPWARAHFIGALFESGDLSRGYEEIQAFLDLKPGPLWEALMLTFTAFVDLGAGRAEDAVAALERSVELSERRHPDMLTHLGVVYETLGRHQDAMGVMNEVTALAKERYVSPVQFARFYAAMGDVDKAFEQLERAYELRCSYLFFLPYLPGLVPQLESDPRWDDLVKRVGLPDKAPTA